MFKGYIFSPVIWTMFVLKIKSLSVSTLIFLTISKDWSKNNAIVLNLHNRSLVTSALSRISQRFQFCPKSKADMFYSAFKPTYFILVPFTPTRSYRPSRCRRWHSDSLNQRRIKNAFNFDPPPAVR